MHAANAGPIIPASASEPANRRWYREPWPWFLMAGPAAVILAGSVTMYLAFHGTDGLVAEDYYARGLAINGELARERYALRAGISALLTWAAGTGRVLLQVHGASAGDLPQVLELSLRHPVRAELDRKVGAVRLQAGLYEAEVGPLPGHRWKVAVECAQWRVSGEWANPSEPTEIKVVRK